MKRQGNEYEVIILGSGLGGLIAGTLLTKNKLSVLFLKENGYQPFYANKGFWFAPFSNFSEINLKPELFQKVSKALNLPLPIDRQEEGRLAKIDLDRPKPGISLQVILPRARIDLFSQRSLFRMEWRREFPKEFSQIENFYNEMDGIEHLLKKLREKEGPQSGFPLRQRSLIKRLLSFDRLPKERVNEKLSSFSGEFKHFIQLQLISRGNLYSDQIPLSLAAYVLLRGEADDTIPDLDLEKLEEKVLEQFFQSGGRVEEIEKVEKVEKGWRKGFTLSLKGGEKVFRSQQLILNSPLHRISNLLSKKGKRLSELGKRIRPRYILVPLCLGIREEVVPVGMNDLLVSILDLEKPYEGGNVLFIALSPKGDETKAPEGKRALTVESLMPLEKWDQTLLMDYQKDVMRHLEQLFPFLENYIELTDWSWANEQVPRWSYPHFLYETTTDFHWREGVVPTRISKRFYFIGKENFPYLGLEGEVISGLMVAEQILKKYH
ncbi:MAG: hypothetical protein AB1502_01090 [Thermodesulfobacteriota bacterium]